MKKMRYLSVILSGLGPWCVDTNGLWKVLANNPPDVPNIAEFAEFVVQGDFRAMQLWAIAWNSGLVEPEKKVHPLFLIFEDKERTRLLRAATEPKDEQALEFLEVWKGKSIDQPLVDGGGEGGSGGSPLVEPYP